MSSELELLVRAVLFEKSYCMSDFLEILRFDDLVHCFLSGLGNRPCTGRTHHVVNVLNQRLDQAAAL